MRMNNVLVMLLRCVLQSRKRLGLPLLDKGAKRTTRARMIVGAVDPAKPVGRDHLCITALREVGHCADDFGTADLLSFAVCSDDRLPISCDPHSIPLSTFEK